jgi:hypothetical protein
VIEVTTKDVEGAAGEARVSSIFTALRHVARLVQGTVACASSISQHSSMYPKGLKCRAEELKTSFRAS